MPKRSSESQKPLTDIIAHGAVLGPIKHADKWHGLDASDAPIVRVALVKADMLRIQGADPGDAYLQGIADMKRFALLSEVAQVVMTGIDAIPEAEQA